jgi:UPF0755 protein
MSEMPPEEVSPANETTTGSSLKRLWSHGLVVGLLGVALVAIGVLAWGIYWYEGQVNPGHEGAAVVVSARSGTSISGFASSLSHQGVIASTLAFRIYTLIHGSPMLLPGRYLMHKHMAFSAVLAGISQGPDVFDIAVPAGFTVAELARRMGEMPGREEASFYRAATDGSVRSPYQPAGSDNLDGLLGTGVYQVLPDETNAAILRQMVARFDSEAAGAGLASRARALGVTPYQAVIVASIVQKEGVYQENDAKVARVIYNRLAAGMPLQMDSTVLYAIGQDGGPVTHADEQIPSPYNTYLNRGLPPTPIAFPSAGALQAALKPAPGAWLYFVVVSPSGREAFSDTFPEQLANEKLAQQRGLG